MRPEKFHQAEKIKSEYADLYTECILHSLVNGPLMLGNLPEATCFPAAHLSTPVSVKTLNFRQKLGHLYEDALTQLLESSDAHDLLSNRIQIQSTENITLGELDYLIRDKETGNFIHLELAIKFYLAFEADGKLSYPGPNARDNFHRKLQRLREHQLQLAKTEAAQSLLKERFGVDTFETQQIVHGIFFHHIDATNRALPEFTAEGCRTRPWLYCRELESFLGKDTVAKLIPKPLWLCEPDHEWLDSLDDISLTDIISIAQQRCTMIHTPSMAEPLFIAPDNWPNQ